MFKVSKLLGPAIILTLVSACDNAKQAEQQTAQATPAAQSTMPANHPTINQAPQQAGLGNLQGGVIKEVLSGGGYTYALVEREGVQIWAAGPESALVVGSLIGWYESTVMRNFNSKSLNRNFKEIHFISAFIDPAKATQARQPKVASAPQQGGTTMGGVITEVLNSGGYTYVNVTNQGQQMWAAGPMVKLEKGQTVTWSGGSKMTNFKSSSLGKTFAEVYFVGAFNKGGTVNATPNEQASAQPQLNQGVVKQIIASAGYSYIEVQSDQKTLWLAAPETAVKVQDKISWANGSVMHNFQSRSLERVFTEIVFVDAIKVAS